MPHFPRQLRPRQGTLTLLLCLCSTIVALAQPEPVKISQFEGNLNDVLTDGARFGRSVANLGDIDRDGVTDIAVGAPFYHSGGFDVGAVWILLLNSDGTVKRSSKINRFSFPLPRDLNLGRAVARLDDFDGDGVLDLAAIGEELLWIILLNSDGSVKSAASTLHQRSSSDSHENLSLSNLGDINGDDSLDIALFQVRESGESVRLLTLRPDISTEFLAQVSAFDMPNADRFTLPATPTLPAIDNSLFGTKPSSIVAFPDPREAGRTRLAIGAPGYGEGALWIIPLRDTLSDQEGGTLSSVKDANPIEAGQDGLTIIDDNHDNFGVSVDTLGDLDGDGIFDLVVGASGDDDGGDNRGAVYVLFMNADGTLKRHQKISETSGQFGGALKDADAFGYSIASLGDINRDGFNDVAVGAPGDDDGGINRGAVWILFNLAAEPEITLGPENELEKVSGGDIEVTVDITDLKGVANATLSFRRGGDPTFFSATMADRSSGSYSMTIPAFAVGPRGIDYFVTATSTRGLDSRSPPLGVASIPISVSAGLNRSITGGPGSDSYRLVSVPLDLDQKSARTIFEDDLGGYEDGNWRLFALDPGSRTVELGVDDMEIIHGRGYWMIFRGETGSFNTGPGTSIRTDSPFPIPLWRGWNLIGNPFAFEVPISNIRDGTDAVPELLRYTGTWEAGTETMIPFEGYAVNSSVPDTLWIDPDMTPASASSLPAAPPRAQPLANPRTQVAELEAIFGRITPGTVGSGGYGPASVSSHPNPFSGHSTIGFELEQTARASLRIYDALGRLVSVLIDDELKAGSHSTVWNGTTDTGTHLASGVYFFRLETEHGVTTGPLTLTR